MTLRSLILPAFLGVCFPVWGANAITPIHLVQGKTDLADGTRIGFSGAADESPMLGREVAVEAIVTAVFQGEGSLGGFYLQEEDAETDSDPLSSEGIFVASDFVVEPGHLARVLGVVTEFEGETRIDASDVAILSTDRPLPRPVELSLPTSAALINRDGGFVANLEALEGMRVRIAQPLTVSGLHHLARFGTMKVSAGGRLFQFTQIHRPDADDYREHRKKNAMRSLLFDDGLDTQNPDPIPVPGLGAKGFLAADTSIRVGDTYTDTVGVLGFGEDQQSSQEEPDFRIHAPRAILGQGNSRSGPPAVGGSLRIASFNILNFFTTLRSDDRAAVGPDPEAGEGPRGAETHPRGGAKPGAGPLDEYRRQSDKLSLAIRQLDADVIALSELENDFLQGGISPVPQSAQTPRDIPIQALVDAINAGTSNGRRYDWVRPRIEGEPVEFLGGDVISVGFLYDTRTVVTRGDAAVLQHFQGRSFVDPLVTGEARNRAAFAQTFVERSTGESVTVVANHFKSKGAPRGDGTVHPEDENSGDGQSYWNGTRTEGARVLLDWLASDPTGSGNRDILILGDLNSYAMEDPIQAIMGGPDRTRGTADDYRYLLEKGSYTFVYDGQSGSLDHALVSPSLAPRVTGAAVWHINADEPDVFDYNLDFGRDPSLYTRTPFRSSDHDPILVGLKPGKPAPVEPGP